MKKSIRLFLMLIVSFVTLFSAVAFAESTGNRANDLLFMAVSQKNLQLAKTAINNGADVNGVNSEGITALYGAVGRNDLNMTNLLLQNGADPNTKSCDGFDQGQTTPLVKAVIMDHDIIGSTLLAHGADPNTVDKDNIPIIFLATFHIIKFKCTGDIQFYTGLINKGADVKSTTPSGVNLLMYIAATCRSQQENKAISIIKYLMSKGLDPNYTMYSEELDKDITALDVAIKNNATAMVNFLLPITKK